MTAYTQALKALNSVEVKTECVMNAIKLLEQHLTEFQRREKTTKSAFLWLDLRN